MIIGIDIGNTNTKLDLISLPDGSVQKKLIIPTQKKFSNDYAELIKKRIVNSLIKGFAKDKIKDVFLVSVVPLINPIWEKVCKELFNKQAIVFQPSILGESNNSCGGNDLIMLFIGALKISPSFIIVNLGTATVFITSEKKTPRGVIITPGLQLNKKTMMKHTDLIEKFTTSKMKVKFKKENKKNVDDVVWNHSQMIEYTIKKIQAELKKDVPVIISGGNFENLKKHLKWKKNYYFKPNLIAEGITETYKIYQNKPLQFLLKIKSTFKTIVQIINNFLELHFWKKSN